MGNIKIKTKDNINKQNIEVKTDYDNDDKNIFLKTRTYIILVLLLLYLCDLPEDKNIASMVKLTMLRSNLLVNSMVIDLGLLTNIANRKYGKTREIYTKIPKVCCIYQTIYKQFKLKARFWQISMLIEICLKT